MLYLIVLQGAYMSQELQQVNSNTNVQSVDQSWQSMQEFYHKIIGRKKSIKLRQSELYQYKIEDIEDVYNRIEQVANSYELLTSAHTFTIAHVDQCTTSVPTFNEFKLLCNAGTKATEAIEIEFNYFIKHSQTQEPFNYKIELGIMSGVAIFEEVQKNFPKSMWSRIGYPTGRADIEFVDFAIGQNFSGIIKNWFESRTVANAVNIITWLQEKSNYIPVIFRYLFLIFSTFFALYFSRKYHIDHPDTVNLLDCLILSFGLILLFSDVGLRFGKAIEKAIDEIWKIAFISVNEGDRKLISKVSEHNKNCFIAIAIKTILALSFAVLTSLITSWIIN